MRAEELEDLENKNELAEKERLMDVKLANRLSYLRAMTGESIRQIELKAEAKAKAALAAQKEKADKDKDGKEV